MERKKVVLGSAALALFLLASVFAVLAVRIAPVSKTSVKAYLAAKNLYLDGNFPAAAAALARLEKKEPKLFQGRLLLAKALYFDDRAAEADAVLGRLVKAYPLYHEAGLWKARTEIQIGKLDRARERLEELLSWQSDDPRILYYLGKIAETSGDVRSALDYWGRAALYEEEGGRIRLDLARLYWKLKMPDRALPEAERALALFPPDSLLSRPAREVRDQIARSLDNGEQQ